MKIGIFAADEIGQKIVSLFSKRNQEIVFLVLDERESGHVNEQIQNTARCKNIYFNKDLYKVEVLEFFESLEIDLIILAWWPYIIKKPLLDIPRMGFLNTHPSLLPYNRGKHYYFWNLIEDVPFGVTLHWIDEKIDSGDIAFQKQLKKSWEDTGFTLRKKGREEIIKLFEDNLDLIISGNIPRKKQDLKKGSFRSSKEIESSSKIDLDKSYTVKELLNTIRARSGFASGGICFEEDNKKYKVNLSIKKVTDE
jgi:methionyl-tRNA formyltransferase